MVREECNSSSWNIKIYNKISGQMYCIAQYIWSDILFRYETTANNYFFFSSIGIELLISLSVSFGLKAKNYAEFVNCWAIKKSFNSHSTNEPSIHLFVTLCMEYIFQLLLSRSSPTIPCLYYFNPIRLKYCYPTRLSVSVLFMFTMEKKNALDVMQKNMLPIHKYGQIE